MKVLNKVEFGDPLLRKKARTLSKEEVRSKDVQTLIENMHYTLTAKNFGVGLAAPQVGEGVAIFVIELQPTEYRPHTKKLSATMINPKITKTFGAKNPEWEGCLSSGKEPLMAKVPRYKKIELEFLDEHGELQTQIFEGLAAQVAQHEIDHLQGILFVDKVEDTKTYTSFAEYKKLQSQK